MIRIFKYELNQTDIQYVDSFETIQLLSIQVQNSKIVIWSIVDDTSKKKTYKILMFGTGHTIVDNLEDLKKLTYLSTVQLLNGELILHIFLEE